MTARPTLRLDGAREETELREYLGDRFELDRLRSYERQLEEEFASIADEQAFYHRSTGYLYNLTAFAMTVTKRPYLETLTRSVPPGARLLDYGCGIGSDGLLLLEAGYRVEFADFDNPSTEYLRWRLRRRGLEAPVHDLERYVPEGFYAGYAFDVIEHVPNPFAFLEELERRCRVVVVNFLEPEPGETALHHQLPVTALVDHAAARGLRQYSLHHNRSHLVVYEPRRSSAPQRALARTRVAGSRLARRAAS